MRLLPVGSRPKCLHCRKELRPSFKYQEIRWDLSPESRKQWRKDHPKELEGYGGYGDSRFCGLTCGYQWALRNTRSY